MVSLQAASRARRRRGGLAVGLRAAGGRGGGAARGGRWRRGCTRRARQAAVELQGSRGDDHAGVTAGLRAACASFAATDTAVIHLPRPDDHAVVLVQPPWPSFLSPPTTHPIGNR
ncbi:hypothetical protein ACP70R_022054 [Stipagrostis hirtigluma subsp. patula]